MQPTRATVSSGYWGPPHRQMPALITLWHRAKNRRGDATDGIRCGFTRQDSDSSGNQVLQDSTRSFRIRPDQSPLRTTIPTNGLASTRGLIHRSCVLQAGNSIMIQTVELVFKRLRAEAGICRPDGARYQPRLHDFRHTFAVTRLVTWYREGKNVQRLLPHLSSGACPYYRDLWLPRINERTPSGSPSLLRAVCSTGGEP